MNSKLMHPKEDSVEIRKFTKAKAIAARCGVHPKTVARWAESGRISRYKVNDRVVLFDAAEVIAYIESTKIAGHSISNAPAA